MEADLTFHKVAGLSAELAELSEEDCDFILSSIKRIASTHLELGWQFGKRAPKLLARMGARQVEAWAVYACDAYDQLGLRVALQAVEQRWPDLANKQLELTAGVMFDEVAGVLGNFVRGLSGRKLTIAQAESIHTNTEKLHLPAVIARLPSTEDNFKLAKAIVALLWAQTRFGTYRADLVSSCAGFPHPDRAMHQLNALETLRLTACIKRELPGLYREMERLKTALGEVLPAGSRGLLRVWPSRKPVLKTVCGCWAMPINCRISCPGATRVSCGPMPWPLPSRRARKRKKRGCASSWPSC